MIRDIGIALWFLIAGVAFFAPYLGIDATVGNLRVFALAPALYALVLISSIVALTLRLTGRRR